MFAEVMEHYKGVLKGVTSYVDTNYCILIFNYTFFSLNYSLEAPYHTIQ